ncbi:uncharacterized protein L969DRAFT_87809 [Mixia osmundae IAM 14324]|uniref:Secreted protein n=1 Tax=Mixia osmundae (strain CBS 9802 / IAM 14324 / JCM 22182 / KY 12970) TaxID=764103 RepID=G7DYX2_MIXOS|nr:uncharacterized protein L969DRAFT_87809 [Mixia osmundae IAM 14324]KEI38614.1 hypothetical protein L969DRAFT_87809 [Mixia osmundae IAM 14324]GAA95782.1 hypothetical protein E5Q_02439 [Mixia osmundae IAM 14324]
MLKSKLVAGAVIAFHAVFAAAYVELCSNHLLLPEGCQSCCIACTEGFICYNPVTNAQCCAPVNVGH